MITKPTTLIIIKTNCSHKNFNYIRKVGLIHMRGTERKLFKLSKLSGYFAACAAVTAVLVMIMPVQVKADEYDPSSGNVTITTEGPHLIKQTNSSPTTNTISINCACTVSLDGVNIQTKEPSSGMHTEDPVPNPINITGSYAVTIDLA